MILLDRQKQSYLYSVAVHIIIVLLFLIMKYEPDLPEEEYLTVGFGAFGELSSSGALGKVDENAENPRKEDSKEKNKLEEKEVDLPAAKNTDDNNVLAKSDKKEDKKETQPEKIKPLIEEEDKENKGRENVGGGEGNFGFELDFGGRGVRKIYSYVIPSYPDGVSKEIDVKLKFTILPDGTVGNIIPLIKADTRLESVAIESLRQWRFEPIPAGKKQADQTVVIIFPFRLQ